MKNFKNHNHTFSGMTFIEVVLAVFMLGSLLSSLLLLQSNVLKNVFQFSSRAERVLLMKDRLIKAALSREKKEKEEKKIEEIKEPLTTINYELKKLSEDSSLKIFKNIVIEKVTAEWDYWGTKEKESMITFLYKPEKKKA
jgi:Tfp pilus assembly protein PilV